MGKNKKKSAKRKREAELEKELNLSRTSFEVSDNILLEPLEFNFPVPNVANMDELKITGVDMPNESFSEIEQTLPGKEFHLCF
jgi:tRNA A-37 threonylcarbamoyl transferase component Bud32